MGYISLFKVILSILSFTLLASALPSDALDAASLPNGPINRRLPPQCSTSAPCPANLVCFPNPFISATTSLQAYQSDGKGLCFRQCAGFAGIKCPAGYDCKFNALDNCTRNNGADCSGMCVATTGPGSGSL